ncbi:MAG: dockerin type I repeat-containing protein, partial [Agathobacter sp.]|nr:dockerin type I repeat-containing protein [Agathobacter sp.]
YDSANNLKATYDIVIYGDTSGDGVISVKDLIMINRHILKKSNLSGAALTAADASKDGNVSIKDLILVNNNILGKSTISQ